MDSGGTRKEQPPPKSVPAYPPNSMRKEGEVSRSRSIEEEQDLKKQIRLLKNRQSAALSRQRKKEYVINLQKQMTKMTQDNTSYQIQISKLTTQNLENKLQIEKLEKEVIKLVGENNDLRGKLKELGVDIDTTPRVVDPSLLSSTSKNLPQNPPEPNQLVGIAALINQMEAQADD